MATFSVSVADPTLPAASLACTVMVWMPAATEPVFHEQANAVDEQMEFSAPSTRSCTCVTPTLSVALPVICTVPETVAPAAGEAMDTLGGVVSTEDKLESAA